MRLRFVGTSALTSFQASGTQGFAIRWEMGDERGVPDAEGVRVLRDHPSAFEQLDGEPVPSRAETDKVEALAGPASDKQVKAPHKRRG